MRFTVLWRPTAEEQLARLWLESKDRDALTVAAHAIDQTLKHSPLTSGWLRPDGCRLLIIDRLAVVYETRPDDRFVFVLDIEHV